MRTRFYRRRVLHGGTDSSNLLFLQRGVWCESDFRARVPSSGVQFLGEGMAKSELGAKPRSPLILH